MEFTHIPEAEQAEFQRCVERAIDIFFKAKINIKLACEIAVNEITSRRSPDIVAAERGQEIWFLLEAEVTTKLREKVGLGQKEDPIVQTAVAENPIGKTVKPGKKPE